MLLAPLPRVKNHCCLTSFWQLYYPLRAPEKSADAWPGVLSSAGTRLSTSDVLLLPALLPQEAKRGEDTEA